MMNEAILKVKPTPVFWANKQAYESGQYRRVVNEGGSRSSKSFSIVQLLITIALKNERRISIVSPSLPHLKKGARKDFLDIMESWAMFKEEDFNRTDNQYKFGKGYIEFFGVENATKV